MNAALLDKARGTQAAFQETRWSLVLRASAGSGEALEELGRLYWPALYAFLRHKGFLPADAEDLTQETFARILAPGNLSRVEAAKGRFRSFLRACAEHEASHLAGTGRRWETTPTQPILRLIGVQDTAGGKIEFAGLPGATDSIRAGCPKLVGFAHELRDAGSPN